MNENPFRPAFGVAPPEIIGRHRQITDFIEALDRGIGNPHRSTIFIGARGMGKTVVLSEIAKEAAAAGWITAQITANPAMLNDAIDQINAKADHLIASGRISLTGISAAGFGVNFSAVDHEPLGWRQKITKKIIELEKYNAGVLFLVDEVHASEPGLKTFLTAYQHLMMEERKVAIALAGLPASVSDLLKVDVITFLRRAYKERLGNIGIPEVREGLRTTFSENGRAIEDDALEAASNATGGYPYLIQMVGFQIWEQSDAAVIGIKDAAPGIERAKEFLASAVHETSMADLSDMDKNFLVAMAIDDGPAKASDLAKRLGKDANYISQYRKRLLDAGVTVEAGYGYLDFAIPLMREYIRAKEEYQFELAAPAMVREYFAESPYEGTPVARYDEAKKRPYLEYPDGRRVYTPDDEK
jgi:hypothetical protein